MIKRGLLAIQLLIDGLLLLFSYYLFYYLKKKEWILQDYYDTYLLILMGTWFLVTIFSKKFREKDHASLFTTMVELFYTTLKIGGVVTIFLYFTSWYDLSRVIIYGSLGFFLILEILFISIWMWLTSHYRFFQIIPLAVWFFLLEWMGLTVCFSFISYLKKGVWIPLHGDSYLFFIILFLWVVIGNRAHGFHFSVEKNLSRTLFPFWKAEVALFLIISFIFFFFKIFYFSRFIILFSIACFAVFENLLIIAWYGYSNRGKIDENDPSLLNAQIIDQISEKIHHKHEEQEKTKYIPPFSQDVSVDMLKKKLGKLYLSKFHELYKWVNNCIDVSFFNITESVVLSTTNPLNIEILEDNSVHFFMNLKEANDFRRLNHYFIQVNEKLKSGGAFIGCFHTSKQYKSLFFKRYPFGLVRILYIFHFIFRRVMPKLPLFKGVYFALTKGRNRILSKAEVLGRLYYCGFSILDVKIIDDLTWFVCIKVAGPREDKNPSYGPLIRMKRLGKGGKIIHVFKFRTMHPYSEYLQNLITDLFGYDEKGKVKDDFRITDWGRFLRKYWLDELPQLLNLFTGELRLVGVRPLSERYFANYPADIQAERLKYKPGCIPPYVAYRMQGLEASIEAERLYFQKKKKHPFWTDVQVFGLALFNILLGRIRSE